MSVVHLIDTLTEWAQANVCAHIKLKQPPADQEAATGEGYEYTLVNPTAFPMYIPTSEKLPPNIHSPYPALCVRFANGQDMPAQSEGFLDVQFCFATWNTGIHGKDILVPTEKAGEFKQWSGEEAEAYFRRSADGWRDAWNFVDIALRAIESTTHIGEYTIDRAQPVKFGPLTEQESIPDLYPTWFAWVNFRVNYPLWRNIQDIEQFL